MVMVRQATGNSAKEGNYLTPGIIQVQVNAIESTVEHTEGRGLRVRYKDWRPNIREQEWRRELTCRLCDSEHEIKERQNGKVFDDAISPGPNDT